MKSRKFFLLSVGLLSLLTVVILLLLNRSRNEPVYEGRPLREWLPALDPVKRNLPNLSARDARRAVRAAGTNSFPVLFRLLRASDSPLKLKLVTLLNKQNRIDVRIITAENLHREAEVAFQLLGQRADAAVPELLRMCDGDLAPDSRAAVVNMLGRLQPDLGVELAYPALLRATTNASRDVRAAATNALRNISTSHLSDPFGASIQNLQRESLLNDLHSTNAQRRAATAKSLGINIPYLRETPDRSLVPILLEALNEHPDSYWVKFSLENINPDMAPGVVTNTGQTSGFNGSNSNPGISSHLLAVGGWSAVVKPMTYPSGMLRGRLLAYESTHYTNRLGESWANIPVELELQDLDTNGTIMPVSVSFDYQTSLGCELQDAQGNQAPTCPIEAESVPAPIWVTIPHDGTVRFRVDRFNVSSRTKLDGTTILLGTNSWHIPAGDTNTWFLSATFKPDTNHPNPIDYEVWSATIKLPPVKIPPLNP